MAKDKNKKKEAENETDASETENTVKEEAEEAKEDKKEYLREFFVSNVFVWTYEDTIAYDLANNTDFASKWSEEAKKQGYINIVQIAGFGVPTP